MKALAASSTGAQGEAQNEVTGAQTKLAAAARQYNEELARNKAAIQASDLETAKLNNSWERVFRTSQPRDEISCGHNPW